MSQYDNHKKNNMGFILLYLSLHFTTFYARSFTFENSYMAEEWTEDFTSGV